MCKADQLDEGSERKPAQQFILVSQQFFDVGYHELEASCGEGDGFENPIIYLQDNNRIGFNIIMVIVAIINTMRSSPV